MPHYPIKIAICFRGGYRSGGRGANLLPTPALPLRLHIYPAAFREKKTGQNTTPAESARIGFIATFDPIEREDAVLEREENSSGPVC
jgi:hypothetical protein